MGFFDRFTSKRPAKANPDPAPDAGPIPVEPVASYAPSPTSGLATAGGIRDRIVGARSRLEAADLAGAMAIYEEVLTDAGDRADVLVAISGDLGTHGHVAQIVELIAPRYDAERHGPATGLNILQAYLAQRNPVSAQHVLDILFALRRPELEERLFGFSNAIAEMLAAPDAPTPNAPSGPNPGDPPKVGLITISKPVWFYGLEPLAAQILPPREGRLRRIAFAQPALVGYPDLIEAMNKPEDELGRLSRALPLWFAETFYFSASYLPVAIVGLLNLSEGGNRPAIFGAEWTTDNLRQVVETSEGGLDYIITGALRAAAGDYELLLRVWEVRGFRERKTFSARWTPATADRAFSELHGQVRAFMEWSPASAAFAYTVPGKPRAWLETLGASLGLFLVEKTMLTAEQLPPVEEDLRHAAENAVAGEAASFAWLTLQARAARLGLGGTAPDAVLARSPLVTQAKQVAAEG